MHINDQNDAFDVVERRRCLFTVFGQFLMAFRRASLPTSNVDAAVIDCCVSTNVGNAFAISLDPGETLSIPDEI
uniref:AraC family transcriptional regulator n=1 Tax=Panagrellus redivivus TaxID=6233 RepID=A0A7E4VIX2_PANRE